MYVCLYVLFSVVNKVVPLVYSPFFILILLLNKNSCNVKLLLFPISLSILCACILIYPSSFAFILLSILFPLFIANVIQMPNFFSSLPGSIKSSQQLFCLSSPSAVWHTTVSSFLPTLNL